MKLSYSNIILLCAVTLLMSCVAKEDFTGYEYAPQMYHSVPYEQLSQIQDKEAGRWLTSREEGDAEFYNSNPNNPYEMNMRKPVEGTVKRSKYLPYRIHKDSLSQAALVKSPLSDSKELVKEGKVLYSRYCQHCHGAKGQGDGLVGKAFKGVPVYNSAALKNLPEGHIFHVITNGKGRMGAHGSQVSVEDRWKIVKYVQTLQKQ